MKVEIEAKEEEPIKCGDCFCVGVGNNIYIRILSSQGVKVFGSESVADNDVYGISLNNGSIIRAEKQNCTKLEQKEPFKFYKK